MNYRHAFHAGNFADVMKHALLTRILLHLRRKETPFRVIDTHAGIGRYDLGASEALRTGEWREGIGRLDAPFDEATEALLAPYRAVIGAVRERYGAATYPGSPAIVREMLRREDRAILIEKHPEDGALLAERFNAIANIKVLRQDGWSVLPGLVPPRERRGLVLIDPPYEAPGGLEDAVRRLLDAVRKWPTGLFALWYPVKSIDVADRMAAELEERLGRPALRAELIVDAPRPLGPLVGSGMIVVNPPWTFASEASLVLLALTGRLGRTEAAESRVVHMPGRDAEPPRSSTTRPPS